MVDTDKEFSGDAEQSLVESPERRRTTLSMINAAIARSRIAVLVLAVLLISWQIYTMVAAVPTVILPSPLDITVALGEMYPVLLYDAGVTALTAALGLTVGVVGGIVLGMWMVRSRTVARTVLPYIVALRIAPLIAIAPLLFLWFGRGIPARALLVATLTIFPITIATVDGLRSTPASYVDLMRSIDASRRDIFIRVRIPAAAPSVFAGLKIAATLSVIGAVVAEFVTLQAGLGYRVFETASFLQTSRSFATLVVLALLGNLFYLVPNLIEQLLWDDEV